MTDVLHTVSLDGDCRHVVLPSSTPLRPGERVFVEVPTNGDVVPGEVVNRDGVLVVLLRYGVCGFACTVRRPRLAQPTTLVDGTEPPRAA